MSNPNKKIYNSNYNPTSLNLKLRNNYEKKMFEMRSFYIRKYGFGKDVLDLCCGTGTYIIPFLPVIKKAVGLDFSRNMLIEFKKIADKKTKKSVNLVESDAGCLPFREKSFDFIFSYASLYHVPDLKDVISEINRVLKNKGIAVIELGNSFSLASVVSYFFYFTMGHARPFHVSTWQMNRILNQSEFKILERRVFQLLPMYVTFKKLPFLSFLSGDFWKRILGVEINGKIRDEIISSKWPFKYFAFRHIFVLEKI